jgi:hypothetical protein
LPYGVLPLLLSITYRASPPNRNGPAFSSVPYIPNVPPNAEKLSCDTTSDPAGAVTDPIKPPLPIA